MERRVKFHQVTKGSLMESEDWWYLVAAKDGSTSVEHEWSHHNAYKTGVDDSGARTFSIADFLQSDAPEEAKEKLRLELSSW